jgi:hypothetical protein
VTQGENIMNKWCKKGELSALAKEVSAENRNAYKGTAGKNAIRK